MSHKERPSHHLPDSSEPFEPTPLPAEMAEFLKDRKFACLMSETDMGTVFILKAPSREIQSLRGRVPIHIQHELYQHPAAPVIRTVIRIYDQPDHPLAFEVFTNIEDEQQRSEFAALAKQDELYFLCYDETLTHRLTKGVPQRKPEVVAEIVAQADRLAAGIPKERLDFDRAKADVMKQTKL